MDKYGYLIIVIIVYIVIVSIITSKLIYSDSLRKLRYFITKEDYERLKKLVKEASKVRRNYHDPPTIINVPNIVEHLDDFEMQLRELSQRI